MKAKITTGERSKGLLGAKVERFVRCEIELTAEERSLFPISGMPIRALTKSYKEEFQDLLSEHDPKFDGILLKRAIERGGDEHVVKSIGQMNEVEEQCLRSCREVQNFFEMLKEYEVEKSYVVDLEDEIKQES